MLHNSAQTPSAGELVTLFTAAADRDYTVDVTATIVSSDATATDDMINIGIRYLDEQSNVVTKYIEFERPIKRGVSFTFERMTLTAGQELVVNSKMGHSDFVLFGVSTLTTNGAAV